MTLTFTPTTFTAGTTMSSSTVNSNFTAMLPDTVDFTGTWVARNNTSVGLTASDYTYAPLSQNVIRLAPPLTCPDRGIVLSALKSGAASDRLGMNALTGKLMTGALDSPNTERYEACAVMTGIGPGTFNQPLAVIDLIGQSPMLNMGTTAASGGSAAAIGYGNILVGSVSSSFTRTTIMNVYIGAGIPWVAAFISQ